MLDGALGSGGCLVFCSKGYGQRICLFVRDVQLTLVEIEASVRSPVLIAYAVHMVALHIFLAHGKELTSTEHEVPQFLAASRGQK